MAEEKISAAGGSSGRGVLPGIPSYVDRVSAESIWRINCNSEADYLRKRRNNPPRSREHFGALHGFEVVRHPTYVSVRRVPPQEAASDASSAHSSAEPRARDEALLAYEAPPPFRSEAMPLNPGTTLVMPKYNRFSSEHMLQLEVNPNRSRTAKGLSRALSTPALHG
mmetsp:Transcript_33445/g.106006  ORF Transcript_33445/g.106006 Transcript_33445/m.106006 type:complete len:167 (+) Transcript_33445:89-589(+)